MVSYFLHFLYLIPSPSHFIFHIFTNLLLPLAFIIFFILITITSKNKKYLHNNHTALIFLLAKHWEEVHKEASKKSNNIKQSFLLLSLFLIILFLNSFGFAIYILALTTYVHITLWISLSICLGILILGIKRHYNSNLLLKIEGFFINFMPAGAPLAMSFLLVPIELISYFIRPLSLGLRLAANLTAGHLLLSIICSYCWEFTQSSLLFIVLISPWLILILLMIMEIAVTIIQAYVLTLLSSIYIKETLEIH